MTQADMIKLISEETNLRSGAVREVLRKFTKYFCVSLQNEENIRIGIGVFELRKRPPRPAYDFQKKEKITLPSASYISFRPSTTVQQVLKERDTQLSFSFVDDLAPVK